MYVPISVISQDKKFISCIEDLVTRANQQNPNEDTWWDQKEQAQDQEITVDEVHEFIKQSILRYSPENDFVNMCSVGSDLQREFATIKTFWEKNGVVGLPTFAEKYKNLYQTRITQGNGGCKIVEIRNSDISEVLSPIRTFANTDKPKLKEDTIASNFETNEAQEEFKALLNEVKDFYFETPYDLSTFIFKHKLSARYPHLTKEENGSDMGDEISFDWLMKLCKALEIN